MDKDWTRAINASINLHFNNAKQGKVLYIEGVNPPATVASWAELRINGPTFTESLKGQWQVDLSVDIMCSSKLTNPDAYDIHKLVGIMQEACINIQINKFTSDVLDSENPFFCLRRLSRVKTLQWGVVKKDVDVYCTSVMADYSGQFQL
jgi:hypothetical protein